MSKLKFIITRLSVIVTSIGLMLTMGLQAVGAEDYIDIASGKMNDDGTLSIKGENANSTKGTVNIFNTMFVKGRMIIAGVTGLLAIVMLGLFTYKAFNLAKASDSPQERARCINGMIVYFIGAACFGSAAKFAGLFYNLLR